MHMLSGAGIRQQNRLGDCQGTQAHFHYPSDVAVDDEGNIIVADMDNNRISKISHDGIVSTLAGSGSKNWGDSQGSQAHFDEPSNVAVDGHGNVIVTQAGLSNCIRRISPDGNVRTIEVSRLEGLDEGIYHPSGIVVDGDGNIIVADTRNLCIRKISPVGNVSTLAGPDFVLECWSVYSITTFVDGYETQVYFSSGGGD
jgi:DNA-binding beta-propeller fold protein YncE